MSSWRDIYKVHPAADAFPMMDDDGLAELGEDIKANGLREPIKFMRTGKARPVEGMEPATEQPEILLDGRNRLEAMERLGIDVLESCMVKAEYVNGSRGPFDFDAVAYIISLNAHRRHLTKAKLAAYIVDAVKAGDKLVQLEPVSKGGRGKKNPIKEKVLAEAKKLGIHESTAKRAIAKSEGRAPKAKTDDDPLTLEDRAEIINEALAAIFECLKEMVGHIREARAAFGSDDDEAFVTWLVKDAGLPHRIAFLVANDLAGDFDTEAASALFDAMLSELLEEPEPAPKPKKKTCTKCHGAGTITSKKTGTTVDCDCVGRAA